MIDSQASGPFDKKGLLDLVPLGKINRNSLVWKEGMDDWVCISNVDELRDVVLQTPPPIPTGRV